MHEEIGYESEYHSDYRQSWYNLKDRTATFQGNFQMKDVSTHTLLFWATSTLGLFWSNPNQSCVNLGKSWEVLQLKVNQILSTTLEFYTTSVEIWWKYAKRCVFVKLKFLCARWARKNVHRFLYNVFTVFLTGKDNSRIIVERCADLSISNGRWIGVRCEYIDE